VCGRDSAQLEPNVFRVSCSFSVSYNGDVVVTLFATCDAAQNANVNGGEGPPRSILARKKWVRQKKEARRTGEG